MRRFRAIVQTNKEPEDHEVIWYKNDAFHIFNNGEWVKVQADVNIGEGLKYIDGVLSIDIDTEEINNTLNAHIEDNKIHIPKESKDYHTRLLVLNSNSDTPKWINNTDIFNSYTISFTLKSSNLNIKEEGNRGILEDILNDIKPCIGVPLSRGGMTVKYWLNPNDWTLKENGEPSRLDGYDGELYMYIPPINIVAEKVTNEDNTVGVTITLFKTNNTTDKVVKGNCFISPIKAVTLRKIPLNMGYLSSRHKGELVSIINNNDYCCGGTIKDDDWIEEDATFISLNGKPRTGMTSEEITNGLRNKKELLSLSGWSTLVWLYVMEHLSFNIQESNDEINPLTNRERGLGPGATTMTAIEWESFYSCEPLFNNSLVLNANSETKTGSVNISDFTYKQWTSWRGFFNLFGDVDTLLSLDNTLEKSEYNIVINNGESMWYSFVVNQEHIDNGVVTNLIIDKEGTLFPLEWDSNATADTTPLYDNFNIPSDDNGTYYITVGGNISSGNEAGLFNFNVIPSNVPHNAGVRLMIKK